MRTKELTDQCQIDPLAQSTTNADKILWQTNMAKLKTEIQRKQIVKLATHL